MRFSAIKSFGFNVYNVSVAEKGFPILILNYNNNAEKISATIAAEALLLEIHEYWIN